MPAGDPTDAISATIAALKDSAAVTALVGTRVFGAELPAAETVPMARESIVVAIAGTPSTSPGTSDWIKWSRRRVDVRCYGPSFARAMLVAVTAEAQLKGWTRKAVGGILIDVFTHTAGPIQFRDPDLDWPTVITTWNVLHADALIN